MVLIERGETYYKHTKQLRMVMYNYYDIIHRIYLKIDVLKNGIKQRHDHLIV